MFKDYTIFKKLNCFKYLLESKKWEKLFSLLRSFFKFWSPIWNPMHKQINSVVNNPFPHFSQSPVTNKLMIFALFLSFCLCLFVFPSIFLSVFPSIFLSVFLSFFLSVSLSDVCHSLSLMFRLNVSKHAKHFFRQDQNWDFSLCLVVVLTVDLLASKSPPT